MMSMKREGNKEEEKKRRARGTESATECRGCFAWPDLACAACDQPSPATVARNSSFSAFS